MSEIKKPILEVEHLTPEDVLTTATDSTIIRRYELGGAYLKEYSEFLKRVVAVDPSESVEEFIKAVESGAEGHYLDLKDGVDKRRKEIQKNALDIQRGAKIIGIATALVDRYRDQEPNEDITRLPENEFLSFLEAETDPVAKADVYVEPHFDDVQKALDLIYNIYWGRSDFETNSRFKSIMEKYGFSEEEIREVKQRVASAKDTQDTNALVHTQAGVRRVVSRMLRTPLFLNVNLKEYVEEYAKQKEDFQEWVKLDKYTPDGEFDAIDYLKSQMVTSGFDQSFAEKVIETIKEERGGDKLAVALAAANVINNIVTRDIYWGNSIAETYGKQAKKVLDYLDKVREEPKHREQVERAELRGRSPRRISRSLGYFID